jgi:2-polyprenyl-3-methyl-5-hydroxy-6-metoxy-1,4-benzoquinol methylase
MPMKTDKTGTILELAERSISQGNDAEALSLLRQSIDVTPSTNTEFIRLAQILVHLRHTDEALAICRTGLTHSTTDPELNSLAADLLIQSGHTREAVPLLYTATMRAPENWLHWHRLGELLQITCIAPDDKVRKWLHKALEQPAIRTSEIARSVASTLCMDADIAALLYQCRNNTFPEDTDLDDKLARLGSDTLLLKLMESVYIPWTPLEQLFTDLRRVLILRTSFHMPSPYMLRFCAALAVQSFLTDYAWHTSEEELIVVDNLIERLSRYTGTADRDPVLPFFLTMIGAYVPLHKLDQVNQIVNIQWHESVSSLIRIQIKEPQEEYHLQSQIPRLTPISDTISNSVRAQYEENPFPRWHHAGMSTHPVSFQRLMHMIGGTVSDDPSFSTPDVLIAGCGTGQQAVTAACNYMNARILAIDLSLTSLGYAARRTRALGIENVKYYHGDLTELGKVNKKFHVIECTGVLVCVDDPLGAWKTLVDILHPGGLMYIALYSEAARRKVVMAREQIAREGYTPSTDDMRRYRRYILDLPDDHPLASLRIVKDMYNISELRDFLFHVKEHRFTIPQISEMLDDLHLQFLGFNINTNAYRRRFPDDVSMTSLKNWHTFEQDNPGTFFGMYQFWVQKPF